LRAAKDLPQARDVLKDVLVVAENTALPTAAEQASTSALARAVRIAGAAETLLELAPVENVRASRHLRIEALLREIDAGFSEPLPEQLQSARGRLMDALKDAPAR
jgi:MoxR-like ATPase